MLLRLFLALEFICTVMGQEYPCLCNDPNLRSGWGTFTPTGNCSGVCEGFQQGHRLCYANINGVVQAPTPCVVSLPCQRPQGCTGTWTTWSGILCSSTCQQIELRFCYKVGNIENDVSTLCLGAEGKSRQMRKRRCYRPGCLNQVTTSTEEMTTNFPTTNMSRIIANPIKGGSIDNIIGTEANKMDKYAQPTPATGIGNDNIKLASILGTSGLVFLTALVIAVAVIVNRKMKQKANNNSCSGTTGALTPRPTFQNNDYETATDPVFLERPQSLDRSHHQHQPLEYSTSVANALYHPMTINNGEPTFPALERTSSEGGPLLPLTPTSPEMKPESIYATIDENRRNC